MKTAKNYFHITALRDVQITAKFDQVVSTVTLERGTQMEIAILVEVFSMSGEPLKLPNMPKKIGRELEVLDALLVCRIR